jgi:hypothetical protein
MREIEALQAQALACLNEGAFSGLMELVQKQEAVQARMAAARQELGPMLKTFEQMSVEEKSEIRSHGVGDLLVAIESVAAAIQGRHQGAFPSDAPASSGAPAASGHPAGHDDDLQSRIDRFRA